MQKWEQLGLSDNFIFQKAMMNERLCTKILTEIIGVEVSKVEYKDYEKTISIRSDAKGIRLDAYIKGEDAVYSVEMQNLNIDNLKKRSRYYHDLIDLDLLEKGCRYKNLNNTYVIFICDFDLFGEEQYKYTFTSKCEEVEGLYLNEGRTTIFMNTKGKMGNISEDCKIFLRAVRSQFTDDSFSVILKSEVERIKSSTEWRTEYMRLSEWLEDEKELAREEGMKEGMRAGIEEGRRVGRQAGMEEFLISLVCKKLSKGESCEHRGVQRAAPHFRAERARVLLLPGVKHDLADIRRHAGIRHAELLAHFFHTGKVHAGEAGIDGDALELERRGVIPPQICERGEQHERILAAGNAHGDAVAGGDHAVIVHAPAHNAGKRIERIHISHLKN